MEGLGSGWGESGREGGVRVDEEGVEEQERVMRWQVVERHRSHILHGSSCCDRCIESIPTLLQRQGRRKGVERVNGRW